MSASLSSSNSGPKFRVAICGGGVGGLVLAITIGRSDPSIPIDVYEAHEAIETAGAGITIWKRTLEVIVGLGLFDEFKEIFTHNPGTLHGPRVRRSDIREGGYPWYQRVRRDGPSSMHRQHMVAVLERNLPASCTVHSNKRLVDYTESEQQDAHSTAPITLNFADGTTATTDVLIGADGVRSAVRKAMFEAASEDKNGSDGTNLRQHKEASFSGTIVYRYLIPTEVLRKESPDNISCDDMAAFLGKGRFCMTYPVSKGSVVSVSVMTSDPSLEGTPYEGRWVSNASPDELFELFDNFEPWARAVVKLCEKPSKWALHIVKPLPFSVRKRVGLLGDASHAMTSHFGAGAGQAIEDAFVLGRLIAHPLTTLERIPEALRIYDEIRLPFATSIANLSLETGYLYAFMAPGYYDGTRREDDLDENGISAYEKVGMESMKQEIEGRWDWIDGLAGPEQQWRDAELKLQALAGEVAS